MSKMGTSSRHAPKKALGQNFLINQGVIRQIVNAVEVGGKTMVEIGPGQGAITSKIYASHPEDFHLVEIDDDLIPILQERFGESAIIHHADILKTDVESLGVKSPFVVFGNLPYYITSPILTHLLYTHTCLPDECVVMMQKEVADKILMTDKKHSVLSLMMHHACTSIKRVVNVSPGSFFPPPKVHSTVLHLTINKERTSEFDTIFVRYIKAAFAQKRKKLTTNLKNAHINIDMRTLEELGHPLDVRAERLSLDDWYTILVSPTGIEPISTP